MKKNWTEKWEWCTHPWCGDGDGGEGWSGWRSASECLLEATNVVFLSRRVDVALASCRAPSHQGWLRLEIRPYSPPALNYYCCRQIASAMAFLNETSRQDADPFSFISLAAAGLIPLIASPWNVCRARRGQSEWRARSVRGWHPLW